jgi:O-succinylbenzoate synthase
VHALLDENIKGHNMAKAAVEMGCWGLAAESAGVSLSSLLGGTRDRVPTGISLGIQSEPSALVARAQAAIAAGYRKIKVKIRPTQDVEYVRAVRRALGAGIGIMADANSAYTLADADHLAQLDAFDLIMLEQPLGDDDLVRHAALQRRLKTPICLDESITSVDRAEDMIQLGSGRIVNIKPGRVGGFTVSKAIHDRCADARIPVWCGGMLESGIGRAYNVALASLPNFSLPGDLSPSARYWERDVVTPEWTMDKEGMVRVPLDRPGLGITVDRDFLDSLTVRKEELSSRPTLAVVR